MKKCPFCAEEIQEEAIYCRYCHQDLSNRQETAEPKTTEERPPKLRNVFWWSILFGLGGFGATFASINRNADVNTIFSDPGFFPNLILRSLSSFILWGLITSLFFWFWRVVVKQTPGIRSFSHESGCSVAVMYLIFLITFFVFVSQGTNVEVMSQYRKMYAAATEATRNPASVYESAPRVSIDKTPIPQPSYTPVQESWELQTRLRQLVSSGYIRSTEGKYYSMIDFEKSLAQIGWHEWYRFPGATTNFIIRTEASWESASETPNIDQSGCGFIFHDQDDDYYIVYLAMDGYVRMKRIQKDFITAQWDEFYQKMEIPADQAELLLMVNDNRATFMVNGDVVLDVVDDAIPTGAYGISVHSGTNKDFGIRCQMKNIEVIELP